MTLKEIASRAGVHVSTVSRILSSPDDSFASKEVRERVWKIVKETGYIPNIHARALRKKLANDSNKKNQSIVCVLGKAKCLHDNPFYAHIARAAEQQALCLGYSITSSYSVLENKNQLLTDAKPIGAVVLGIPENDSDINILKSKYNKNIVFVDRTEVNYDWDQILCNGYESCCLALKHLFSYGHSRIAYIGETKNDICYKAYCDFLNSKDIKIERSLVISTLQNTLQGGYESAGILLSSAEQNLPTAIFSASDITAIGIIKRLKESKIKIPKQISIISIDNIDLSGFVAPMLTTVAIPVEEMGKIAVQILDSRIKKMHKLPLKIYLQEKLIQRESVLNLNRGIYI